MKDILSQPWLGSVLGVLGLLAALIFYLRSRRTSRLAFQHDTVTLVGSQQGSFPNEIEIHFSGVKVPRVTLERLVIWNAGNTTISGSQIVQSDPVRLSVPEGESFLKADIMRVSRPVNGCQLHVTDDNRRSISFEFDFLDPGDGVAVEALHTSDQKSLRLCGTIRGIPKGISRFGRARWFTGYRTQHLPFPFDLLGANSIYYIACCCGLIIISMGVFRPEVFFTPTPPTSPTPSKSVSPQSRWMMITVGFLYAAFPGGVLWIRRRKYPGNLEFGNDHDHRP